VNFSLTVAGVKEPLVVSIAWEKYLSANENRDIRLVNDLLKTGSGVQSGRCLHRLDGERDSKGGATLRAIAGVDSSTL